MHDLYPLRFTPILKERVWGGKRLGNDLGKSIPSASTIGESWEISGMEGYESVVSNGFLSGNNINELVEVYMGDLVGEQIYERYGDEFPLLVKLIDASRNLSVQVHPDDKMAAEEHHAFGKTELWYIMEAEEGASLFCGFRDGVTREHYLDAVSSGTIESLLNRITVKSGEWLFVPAGMVHSIGKGILLAEIQQPSDITYRIYDWDRGDGPTPGRELHTGLAEKAIDFNLIGEKGVRLPGDSRDVITIADNRYFRASIVTVNDIMRREYALLDSFVAILCTRGKLRVESAEASETLNRGESLLLPATSENALFTPVSGGCEFLEISVPTGDSQ